MFDVDELTDAEANAIWRKITMFWSRAFRAAGYALLTYILVRLNTYGVNSAFWLAVVVGVMGLGSASARLGHLAIAVLLIMVLVPIEAITLVMSQV